MIEKSALAGDGMGGACPPPLALFTITFKVAVYGPAESADTFISTLYVHVLCGYGYHLRFNWVVVHLVTSICFSKHLAHFLSNVLPL
jgi:hypothetical protein